MAVVAIVLAGIVALEHLYIMVMEMFLWTSSRTRRTFGTTEEFARATRSLAANQGLYNGFLAAGILWGLLYPDETTGYQIQAFFLVCVWIAAIYGAWTVKKRILYVQGIPAAAALIAILALW
jgi:putative membrane protein